jgi:low temperature requirement protein LtrA
VSTSAGLEDRSVSTLELFFDLVFVFGITQVVSLFEGDSTVGGFLRAALILAMLWWTWSLFTWTTNWTRSDDRAIRFFLPASMGAVLLLSLAVPEAYAEDGLLFALPYFLVRIAGLGLYWLGARDNPLQREVLFTFLPLAARLERSC